ncbi:MAG: type II toxin-antitoxin system HicA family toxin [Candidatus Eremiobacteraeota bacterium]|nr:type II toxin-antitoxin system HicA family toxin [Candidatus Eremiobacteraeota bacterium]
MKAREVQRRLLREGWILQRHRGAGSHRIFKHPSRIGTVVLPWHMNGAQEVPAGTLLAIAKTAGWQR